MIGKTLLALALAAAPAAAGAAEAAPEPASTTVPAPETPEGTRYGFFAIGKIESLENNRFRYAGYIVDMPGFPLALFSDPDRKDEAAALLTVCLEGASWDKRATDGIEWTMTYYYDETPDGDFDDLDTFCGGEEGVRGLGGLATTRAYRLGSPAPAAATRAVTLEGADGRTVRFPAPVGTEYIGVGENDPDTGLRHIWAFVVATAE